MYFRNEYPRPQMRRDDWIPLNGEWQFCFDDASVNKASVASGAVDLARTINVPFSYQYPASGIGETEQHDGMWYKRAFTLTPQQLQRKALLCFNAVDYQCSVWLNGVLVGTHKGGFTAFTLDVSDVISANNTLVVYCFDDSSDAVARGKQSWKGHNFGCWYTPNSGIWQSVWLEFFDGDCVDNLGLVPDAESGKLAVELRTLSGIADCATLEVLCNGEVVSTHTVPLSGKFNSFEVQACSAEFASAHLWSPASPNLLYLNVSLLQGNKVVDVVRTRFGLRTIAIKDGVWTLNGKPLYQRLILDQGYFAECGLTAESVERLREDIVIAQQMGFNGARKHQKLEDPYFYYFADELGYLVWCEMPSAYRFNSDEQANLIADWQQIVLSVRNNPSVICYVPLNESWGVEKIVENVAQQNFAAAMYFATKALDGTRVVSTNDGWENPTQTDIVSIHDYAYCGDGFAEKYKQDCLNDLVPAGRRLFALGHCYHGQPVLFTEFGGIAMQRDETCSEDWGYNSKAADDEEFYTRYGNLMSHLGKMWFQGFCYTQLTDVQQEINGLLDAHHNPKFDVQRIKKLTEVK